MKKALLVLISIAGILVHAEATPELDSEGTCLSKIEHIECKANHFSGEISSSCKTKLVIKIPSVTDAKQTISMPLASSMNENYLDQPIGYGAGIFKAGELELNQGWDFLYKNLASLRIELTKEESALAEKNILRCKDFSYNEKDYKLYNLLNRDQ
ncbi:MAG: hypothetical protein WA160_04790 [Pseudobdellovibrio sp.]